MLDRIILFSLRNRLFIILAAVLIVIAGAYTVTRTEVDVFPDLNAPTVVVMTEAGGMATEDVEQLVTFPIETAVNGSIGVRRVRSQSTNGFSVVQVEFDWGTDIYLARQIVSEKLASISEQLPDGVSAPVLGPQSSILGEVLIVSLTSDSTSMLDLRTIADWVIRPRLLSTMGVAQVSVQGGDIKEYQVCLNPQKMKHYGVTLPEVMEATRGMNNNQNGGVIYEYGNEYIVRGVTSTNDIAKIAMSVIRKNGDSVLTLADIADVKVGGQQPKLGKASERGKPAVLLTVTKQPSTGTMELTAELDSAIADACKNIPADVHVSTDIFRQSSFIESSIDNVKSALIEGAFFVVIVLFLFLANVRTTVISLVTIPLSFLVTVIVLYSLGISINTMTLGGLAIAIGSLVDDAIVDVENVWRKLRQGNSISEDSTAPSGLSGFLTVIYEASREVRMPILNSTLIIVVSFVPLFFLDGMEGRMLIPLGIAFITALFASTVVALTLTPVMCSYLLKGKAADESRHESRVASWLKCRYERALGNVLQHKKGVVCGTVAMFALAIVVFCTLGSSFLPSFNEGSFTINISSVPGISLEESDAIGRRAEKLLLEIPEIQTVARKTGRAELDEHALGVNVSEIEAPFVLDGRSHAELLDDVRSKLSILSGVNIEIGQPISHRIDAMLSGTQSSIAIKLFGTDLNRMFTIGHQIKEAIEDVEGIADLNVEQQVERPELKITPRRELLVSNGITLPEFNEFLAVNLSGETVGQVYESGRSFNLVVRAGDDQRNTMENVRNLIIDTRDGRKVPLSDVADIESSSGPNTVNRENVQRKIVISANTSGRDLGSVVADIKERVGEDVVLPEGYRVEYGGQFESQESASRILMLACLVSIIVIYLLLYVQFRDARESAVILLNLPLALIGGVFALLLTTGEVSIPAIIGFISLFGIATRNGMLLISEYGRLREVEGLGIREAVVKGSLSRLNPILMTALTSALALVPLALGGELPGNEIQSPMAKVILGGLISSTILNAFVIPIVYEWIQSTKQHIVNRKLLHFILLGMLLAVPSVSAKAQSVDSVLQVVEQSNLQLRALRHDNDATILEMKSANTLAGPSVEYSPFYQKEYSGVATSELVVSEQIDFPTLYSARSKQARLQGEALSRQYEVARRDVLLEAEMIYCDIVKQNNLVDMLSHRLVDSERMLALYQKRIEAGDASILELNKVKLDRMEALTASAQAESERLALLQQLQTLAGGVIIDVTSTVFPERMLPSDVEAFISQSMVSSSDILAAEAALKSSEQSLRISRQSWLPSLTFGYRRNTEQKENFNGFLVGMSFPVFSNSSGIKAAQKRRESAELQLKDARLSIEARLRSRYAELQQLRRVLDNCETDMLTQTIQLLRKAFEQGELSALTYYSELANIYAKLETHLDIHCRYSKLIAEISSYRR